MIQCPDTHLTKTNEKVPGFKYMNNTDKFKHLVKIDGNITRESVQFIKGITNKRGKL